MPAPIMAPMPSATRLSADKVRLSGTPSCVVSACTSGSSASASNTESGLRTQIFAMTFPHYSQAAAGHAVAAGKRTFS